ncbi:MAG: hypothetical protein IPI92_14380 [Gemmatimonadetes bacterium]|nr:hypothetical protein [Gemmatimonadota bacterium]MBK7786198.1 hypothetical protein [Gemmatimonadota bacterium]MBK9065584.1 hypothetical protein [Gemmatimonadota bacterium]
MAPNPLTRAVLAGLLVGLAACGGKKDAAPEAVDLAAIRAKRDSVRRAATQDSVVRARFKTCSDSVNAALAKAARGKKPAPAPAGMLPPEVLKACGNPPAAPAVAAKPDSAKPAATPQTAKADTGKKPTTTAQAARPDTTKVEAPAKPTTTAAAPTAQPGKPTTPAAAPAPQTPVKPTLTPQQLQVLRQDSIRQARERAKADSLRQLAERQRQDSITKAQRDSVRADSIRIARETEVLRETFTYAGGARDPFASLITEDKVGPEFNDLLLVGVYLDLRRASNSVAVLRDKTNQKRYKLRVGDRLGRLKVAQIRQADVVFTVEDIGFERQETLSLRKREEQTP